MRESKRTFSGILAQPMVYRKPLCSPTALDRIRDELPADLMPLFDAARKETVEAANEEERRFVDAFGERHDALYAWAGGLDPLDQGAPLDLIAKLKRLEPQKGTRAFSDLLKAAPVNLGSSHSLRVLAVQVATSNNLVPGLRLEECKPDTGFTDEELAIFFEACCIVDPLIAGTKRDTPYGMTKILLSKQLKDVVGEDLAAKVIKVLERKGNRIAKRGGNSGLPVSKTVERYCREVMTACEFCERGEATPLQHQLLTRVLPTLMEQAGFSADAVEAVRSLNAIYPNVLNQLRKETSHT